MSEEASEFIHTLITKDMNHQLLTPFSNDEIKAAIFSLRATKAPSPDGLSGTFFQKSWEIIKDDIFQEIKIFFESGELLEKINETHVALVPKIKDPEELSHYWPINCCNFLYKIIAKILADRMKHFMNSIISPNQSAFVSERQIQDNILIVQEAFHFMHRKANRKSNFMAIKLDMNKRYDRVEWSFVEEILIKFGFCSH